MGCCATYPSPCKGSVFIGFGAVPWCNVRTGEVDENGNAVYTKIYGKVCDDDVTPEPSGGCDNPSDEWLSARDWAAQSRDDLRSASAEHTEPDQTVSKSANAVFTSVSRSAALASRSQSAAEYPSLSDSDRYFKSASESADYSEYLASLSCSLSDDDSLYYSDLASKLDHRASALSYLSEQYESNVESHSHFQSWNDASFSVALSAASPSEASKMLSHQASEFESTLSDQAYWVASRSMSRSELDVSGSASAYRSEWEASVWASHSALSASDWESENGPSLVSMSESDAWSHHIYSHAASVTASYSDHASQRDFSESDSRYPFDLSVSASRYPFYMSAASHNSSALDDLQSRMSVYSAVNYSRSASADSHFESKYYSSLSASRSDSGITEASNSESRYPGESTAASWSASDAASVSDWLSDFDVSISGEMASMSDAMSAFMASTSDAMSEEDRSFSEDWSAMSASKSAAVVASASADADAASARAASASAHDAWFSSLARDEQLSVLSAMSTSDSEAWSHAFSDLMSSFVSASDHQDSRSRDAMSASAHVSASTSAFWSDQIASASTHAVSASDVAASHRAYVSASDAADPCGQTARKKCEAKKHMDGGPCKLIRVPVLNPAEEEALDGDCVCECGQLSDEAWSKSDASDAAWALSHDISHYESAAMFDSEASKELSTYTQLSASTAGSAADASTAAMSASANADASASRNDLSKYLSASDRGFEALSDLNSRVDYANSARHASTSASASARLNENPCDEWDCGECGSCSVTEGYRVPVCDCRGCHPPTDIFGNEQPGHYNWVCMWIPANVVGGYSPPPEPVPPNYPNDALNDIFGGGVGFA